MDPSVGSSRHQAEQVKSLRSLVSFVAVMCCIAPWVSRSATPDSRQTESSCRPSEVVAWGDSLTYGLTQIDGVWQQARPAWVDVVRDVAGVLTKNFGFPSLGSAEVAVRLGPPTRCDVEWRPDPATVGCANSGGLDQSCRRLEPIRERHAHRDARRAIGRARNPATQLERRYRQVLVHARQPSDSAIPIAEGSMFTGDERIAPTPQDAGAITVGTSPPSLTVEANSRRRPTPPSGITWPPLVTNLSS